MLSRHYFTATDCNANFELYCSGGILSCKNEIRYCIVISIPTVNEIRSQHQNMTLIPEQKDFELTARSSQRQSFALAVVVSGVSGLHSLYTRRSSARRRRRRSSRVLIALQFHNLSSATGNTQVQRHVLM